MRNKNIFELDGAASFTVAPHTFAVVSSEVMIVALQNITFPSCIQGVLIT